MNTPRIGLALSSGRQLALLPERLPAGLSLLEFPGEFLESAADRRRLGRYVSSRTAGLIRDIVDPGVSRLVAGESLSVRLEFFKLLRARCRRAAELRVRECSLDLDLPRVASTPEWALRVSELLQGCWGIFDEFEIRLRLPLRLSPEPGGLDAEKFLELRRRMLYPAVAPLLECCCEEFRGVPFQAEELLGGVAFYGDCWHLVFSGAACGESEAGAVKRLLRVATERVPRECRVYLAPGAAFFEDFLAAPEVAVRSFEF